MAKNIKNCKMKADIEDWEKVYGKNVGYFSISFPNSLKTKQKE